MEDLIRVFVAETDTRFRPLPVEVVAESSERIGVRGLGTEDIRSLADESPAITDAPDNVHASDVTTPADDGHVKTRTKNQRRAIVAGLSANGGNT